MVQKSAFGHPHVSGMLSSTAELRNPCVQSSLPYEVADYSLLPRPTSTLVAIEPGAVATGRIDGLEAHLLRPIRKPNASYHTSYPAGKIHAAFFHTIYFTLSLLVILNITWMFQFRRLAAADQRALLTAVRLDRFSSIRRKFA
jgi:hypothetical protein